MMMVPPSIEATPLHTIHNILDNTTTNGVVVASASFLRGSTGGGGGGSGSGGGNGGANGTLSLAGDDGGDIVATILHEGDDVDHDHYQYSKKSNDFSSNNSLRRRRRRVVVQRMDGETIASFELPPGQNQNDKPSSLPSLEDVNHDNERDNNEGSNSGWQGYANQIVCWASFRSRDDTTTSTNNFGNGSVGGGMGGGGGRKMLCVLADATTLRVFDVLGDAALLATTPNFSTSSINNTNSGSNNGSANGGNSSGSGNSSSGNPNSSRANANNHRSSPVSITQMNAIDDNDGGGPAGHSIPLPFRARSIFSAADGEGLLISRMPSQEDYLLENPQEYPQEYQMMDGNMAISGEGGMGGVVGGGEMSRAPLPPLPPRMTPKGMSLPATPRSLRRPAANNTANANTLGAAKLDANNDENNENVGGEVEEEEELSLEDPPEPVRFRGSDNAVGNPGFDPAASAPSGTTANIAATASAVPCLFSLRHPLDEIRPLAVTTDTYTNSNNDDDDGSSLGDINTKKLFSNVSETLVYVNSPRLFHGMLSDNASSALAAPICVTYNEALQRHTVWSLMKRRGSAEAMQPLWKSTGRGGWREEEGDGNNDNNGNNSAAHNAANNAAGTNGKEAEGTMNDHDESMSQDSQANVQPIKTLLSPVEDDEDVSMDDDPSSSQHQQGHGSSQYSTMNAGGVPSAFSDIHPDFVMRKLFVEEDKRDGALSSSTLVAGGDNDNVPSENGDDIMVGTDTAGSHGDARTKKRTSHHQLQRHVFLATDSMGTGDLVLCIFMPNPDITKTNKASLEPAILKCYNLHLTPQTDDTTAQQPHHKTAMIRAVSHVANVPCESAQPVQAIPVPLAPFSWSEDGGIGVGSSSRSERRRRRSSSRTHGVEVDMMCTDVLVFKRHPQRSTSSDKYGSDGGDGDADREDGELRLGLYRGGTIHVADFTLPRSTLDNFCETHVPRKLENAVGNRVDVQFAANPSSDDEDGMVKQGRGNNIITVRASFSLVMHASPIAETALRAIESSLVPCCSDENKASLQQSPNLSMAASLPFLIRADCMRLFQLGSISSKNNGKIDKKDSDAKVEDAGWYALTVVLLNLFGMKWDESMHPTITAPTTKPPTATGKRTAKKPSAWDALLQSDFHSAFCEGEGQLLFGDSLDLDCASLDSSYRSDFSEGNAIDDNVAGMLSSLTCTTNLIDSDAIMADETDGKLMNAPILLYQQAIFDALHLLHEDSRLKSQSSGSSWTRRLGTLLLHVTGEVSPSMIDYEDHYRRLLGDSRCGSNACNSYSMRNLEDDKKRCRLSNFAIAPCIMTALDTILQLGANDSVIEDDAVYVISGYKGLMDFGMNGVCSYTWMVLRLFITLFDRNGVLSKAKTGKNAGLTTQSHCDRAAILAMLDEGIYHSIQLQDELPLGVVLPLLEAIRRCRLDPPQIDSAGDDCWPPAAFDLLGRNDLAEYLSRSNRGSSGSDQASGEDASPSSSVDPDNDGLVALEDYSSMIFPSDNRVREAARLLRSSRPLFLRVPRPVELSDHDYERSKQEKLLLLCRRSISLPLGRGMLTLGTHNVQSAEQLLIPNIVLAGRVPPANGTLALDMSSCPNNFRVWPEFHNGVASGLRLPRASANKNERTITRTWIKFNKPVSPVESAAGNSNAGQTPPPSYAHGGFLMALGLRGYLSALTTTDLTDYLTQGTITTTVGVFLGMAANKRGSCDPSISKMLCLHIPSLLPPSFIPMDLASTVQAAAVAGIGLLYQGSSHRLMSEFLLNEIGRQPMKDQNSNDREGFALVCGLALGMVNLEKGTSTVSGLEDLRIEERLHRYISGASGGEFHSRKDGFEGPVGGGAQGDMDRNSRIYEVNSLNRDVTAPGATLALGLMYIKSHNVSIASSLQLPETHFSLDYIRPDLLALRVISRSLIMWNDIEPTSRWIDIQVPSIVNDSVDLMKNAAKRAMSMGNLSDPMDEQTHSDGDDKTKSDMTNFDPQAVRAANAYIVAGACFALGLKYAGSANRAAASAIIERTLWFLELRDNKDVVSLTQRPDSSTLITCLCTAAISLAMVMAGTGDLDAFRLFRALRWKCDDGTLYGTHMAFGSAIGLLFLGAGKCTLGSTPEDVAMLITAFYPHFPILSSDNQYHLQALRHLYVLAVHERILEACDVDSNEKICIPLELTVENSNEPVQVSTPFLVANDSKFVELRLNSDRYYPIVINARHWNSHGNLRTLFVKRKAGHLSYLQDPNGLRSLSMKTGSADQEAFLKSVKLFSNDAMLASFSKYFCFSSFEDDKILERFCRDIAYECMREEKSSILPIYLKLFRLIESEDPNRIGVENVWDAKLLMTYAETRERLGGAPSITSYLVNGELLSRLCEHFGKSFHTSETELLSLRNKNWWENRQLSGALLIWNGMPIKCAM